jgi:hypothetical protein
MKTFSKYFENASGIDVNYINLDKEYITKLDSNDCYLSNTPKSDEVEYECKDIIVYWGLVFNDESNIGLSKIDVYVKKITCIILITTIDELGNIVGDPVEEELILTYDKINYSVEINSNKEVSYFPKDLTIYYDKKSCEIEIGN